MKLKNPVTFLFAFVLLVLTACTSGLEEDYEDKYGYLADVGYSPSSSSSVIPGSDPESSSSAGQSYSSSIILSGSEGFSSSSIKACWSYLNPDIEYSEFIDSRDNQVYKTVTIGTQTWMAENLSYKTDDSYCYDDNANNCFKYGRLYLWSMAMEACPSGWHLPNDDEWNALWTFVGGVSIAGMKLKSTDVWNDQGYGTDSFGFAVLPAGFYFNGYFGDKSYGAYFWSSNEKDRVNAYEWNFDGDNKSVRRDNDQKKTGFSVRCLRDFSERLDASSSSSQASNLSSSSANEEKCAVENGVKVIFPDLNSKFKVGDTIGVVYGSDVVGSGYRFVYKTSESDAGLDLLESSAGPENPDGKTCYVQKVVLSGDIVDPSKTAFIRVIPYENVSKGASSESFVVEGVSSVTSSSSSRVPQSSSSNVISESASESSSSIASSYSVKSSSSVASFSSAKSSSSIASISSGRT